MAKRIASSRATPIRPLDISATRWPTPTPRAPPLPAIRSCISRWRGSRFRWLRTAQEFESGALPETLIPARDAIVGGRAPGYRVSAVARDDAGGVKAFLEQIMRPGIAFAYRSGGPNGMLAGRSARIVVTMGMPAFLYRWYFGGHGLRGLERSILRFTGIKPVRETLFGGVGDADEARRRRWLDRMRNYGRSGV